MYSDNISKSMNDWKIFESLSIDHNLAMIALCSWVNNFEGADKSVLMYFVWECSVSDNTIEMNWFGTGKRNSSELLIGVFL